MWSRSATKVAAAVLAGVSLAGCSDIYYDRRDGISIASGDAVATNRVTHTIDPWSPASANRNIAYNGEKMQAAVERYRTGRVIQPVSATTSSTAYGQQSPVNVTVPPPAPAPAPPKP